MSSSKFCVFILTYGRPYDQVTYRTLIKKHYEGDVFFVCSSDDDSANILKAKYGDKVLVFNKGDFDYDIGDNHDDQRAVVYARNACFHFAKKLGYRYFVQFDDDYTEFAMRHSSGFKFKQRTIKNINSVFDAYVKFLEDTGCHSVAMSQGGDFIGGEGSTGAKWRLMRKCMNSWFCSTDKAFDFVSRFNDDVIAYTRLGNLGKLFFTAPSVCLFQPSTQKVKGGMTETYLDSGTYVKSFHSVMYNPSCVKINLMGNKNKRIHHKIMWNNAVPKILSESLKK